MLTLFTEPYENLIQFIFNLYDFKRIGEISRKDIQIVFSYIPLNNDKIFPNLKFKYEDNNFQNQLNSQSEINFYLDKTFKTNCSINEKYYKQIVEEESSETFLFVKFM